MITDQELVHEFIDKRPSTKTLEELHKQLVDRQLEYLLKELRSKKSRSCVLIPNASTIHYVDKDGYFGSLGVSQPHDLLTDNFGLMMSFLFTPSPSFMTSPNTLKDTSGSLASNFWIRATPTSFPFQWIASNAVSNMYIQLGSGLTSVARSDFNIQTALLTAPESGLVLFSNPCGYGSGVLTMIENVGPFGATETVREAQIVMQGSNTSNVATLVCMMRYNYSPTIIPIGMTAVTQTTINI